MLHTLMRPSCGAPAMFRAVPSAEKDMKFATAASPAMTMPVELACALETTISPVSTAASVVERVVSTKTIHPCAQLPVVTQDAPSALLQTVIRVPRRIASLLAKAMALTKSLLLVVTRLEAMLDWKLGTPMASKTPMTAIPTMSSIKVTPRDVDVDVIGLRVRECFTPGFSV